MTGSFMKKHADPGIDEVRAARMEVTTRYGHNVDCMIADHIKQQSKHAGRLVKIKTAPKRRKSTRQVTRNPAMRAG
jgi:hypothetical protein